MNTTHSNQTSDAIHQVYEQFSDVLRRQAEQIENLHQSVKSLQIEQRQLEDVASHLVEPLERSLASDDATDTLSPAALLACVRRFAAAAHVGQIFETLAEESAHMGVRAAVFDVRGRAAWGASASGFEPELDGSSLRALVVPLHLEGPFRQVFESAETLEARPANFEKEGRVLAKLAPSSNARILLVPIRSAGSVVAVLYAETGERRDPKLFDSLQVLAEFAGGQVDRLMVANGGLAAVGAALADKETGRGSEQAGEDKAMAPEPEAAAAPEIPGVAAPGTSPSEFSEPAAAVEQTSSASPEIHVTAAEPAPAPEPAEAAAPPRKRKRRFIAMPGGFQNC